jgi:hypothetical protein
VIAFFHCLRKIAFEQACSASSRSSFCAVCSSETVAVESFLRFGLIDRQTDRQPARFGLIDSQPEGTHYLIASGHFPLNTPVPSLPPSCTTRYAFGLVAVIRWSAFVFRESDSERDRASTRAPEFPIKLSERVLS